MQATLLKAFLFLLVPCYVAADNTTDVIHQLKQKISDLESHSQASEQKQAAVLASILSKLQSQEQKFQEEIDDLLSLISNSTDYIQQLEQKVSDLENHTRTSEQQQEQKIQENTADLQNLTTECKPTVPLTDSQRVAFEVRRSSEASFNLIKFDKVTVNDGSGYDLHRGMFIVPKTGTYQFWFTVYVSEENKEPSVTFDVVKLVAGNADLGPSFGGYVAPIRNAFKSFIRVVQGQHVVPLKAGETVSVQLQSYTKVKAGSSFGGVLLD